MRQTVLLGAVVSGLGLASSSLADTLVLRSGRTLKIEALSCGASFCRVSVQGGEFEIPALQIDRVELEPLGESPRPPAEVEFGNEIPAVAPPPADSDAVPRSPRSVEEIVADAAHRYGLPASLVRAVARAESSFRPDAVSRKGAQGVMQLMPGTARELGVKDPFDPAQNVEAGARLLRQLLEKYEGRVAEALAAYNAGPGAVARHQGVPPYPETRSYIRKVVKDFQKSERSATPSSEKGR